MPFQLLRVGVILAVVLGTVPLLSAHAQAVPGGGPSSLPRLPQPVGFVNDFAKVVPAECAARIERITREVRAKSKGEIAVVTLGSLRGRPIEEWSRRIGRDWGVGFAGAPDDPRTNTGVVVLLAPAERRSRLELADGANAFISDARAGEILDEELIPSVKRGDAGSGLLRVVNAVALEFAGRFDFTLESTATECEPRGRRK